jgi:hypothetical protein
MKELIKKITFDDSLRAAPVEHGKVIYSISVISINGEDDS